MNDADGDRETAEGLRRGSRAAWLALYDRYAERLWRRVARLVGPADASAVADVLQATLLAAAESARTFDLARGALWPWLCAVARNQVALHYRRRGPVGLRPAGNGDA